MKRSPFRRRTRLRRVGPKGRARARRLEAVRPLIMARCGNKCESPFCRKTAPRLDLHHIVKRSAGGIDDPSGIVALCRACHVRLDLPEGHRRRLSIRPFGDGRLFVCFQEGAMIQAVSLAMPQPRE